MSKKKEEKVGGYVEDNSFRKVSRETTTNRNVLGKPVAF